VLITGGTGLLGRHLQKCYNHFFPDVHVIVHGDRRPCLTDPQWTWDNYLDFCQAGVVIHCAAMTHPMEAHEKDPELASKINVDGSQKIINWCGAKGARIVFISTDYVYRDPTMPPDHLYKETQKGAFQPIVKYGRHKLDVEIKISRYTINSLVIRASFTNFPFKHERAVVDSYKSFAYVHNVAPMIMLTERSGNVGTYNIGGKRRSIYDFAVRHRPKVGMTFRDEITGYQMPENTAMCLDRLEHFSKVGIHPDAPMLYQDLMEDEEPRRVWHA